MKKENPNRDGVAAGAEAVENYRQGIDTAESAQLQARAYDDKPRLLIDNANPDPDLDAIEDAHSQISNASDPIKRDGTHPGVEGMFG